MTLFRHCLAMVLGLLFLLGAGAPFVLAGEGTPEAKAGGDGRKQGTASPSLSPSPNSACPRVLASLAGVTSLQGGIPLDCTGCVDCSSGQNPDGCSATALCYSDAQCSSISFCGQVSCGCTNTAETSCECQCTGGGVQCTKATRFGQRVVAKNCSGF